MTAFHLSLLRMRVWPRFGLDSRSVIVPNPLNPLSISRAQLSKGAVFRLDFCLMGQTFPRFPSQGKIK